MPQRPICISAIGGRRRAWLRSCSRITKGANASVPPSPPAEAATPFTRAELLELALSRKR